jgi:hypothetical protein
MNTKNVVLLGAVLGVGYLAYKFFNTAKEAVEKGYQAAVDTTADALYFAFGPAIIGTDYYYTVNFAGGVKHAIPKASKDNPTGVDSSGRFTYNGKQFVIRDKKSATGAVEHWAFTP